MKGSKQNYFLYTFFYVYSFNIVHWLQSTKGSCCSSNFLHRLSLVFRCDTNWQLQANCALGSMEMRFPIVYVSMQFSSLFGCKWTPLICDYKIKPCHVLVMWDSVIKNLGSILEELRKLNEISVTILHNVCNIFHLQLMGWWHEKYLRMWWSTMLELEWEWWSWYSWKVWNCIILDPFIFQTPVSSIYLNTQPRSCSRGHNNLVHF